MKLSDEEIRLALSDEANTCLGAYVVIQDALIAKLQKLGWKSPEEVKQLVGQTTDDIAAYYAGVIGQIKQESYQKGIKEVVRWVEERKRPSREVAELFIGDIKIYEAEWQAFLKEELGE